MSTDRIDRVVREFLRTELGIDEDSIGPDTALLTTGLVDSAGLVRLAALLEMETSLIIPDRDVNADNFDTIRRIQAYVAGRIR